MSFEEAYAILINRIAPNPTATDECIDLCKIAIDRQIPKKVYTIHQEKTGEPIQFLCPCCGKSALGSGFYCWHCGQHLSWELEEVQ